MATTPNQEAKYIRIPIWLAAILAGAVLTFLVDTWRTVNKVDIELRCLRTELAAKGIIGPKLSLDDSAASAKSPSFGGIIGSQTNQFDSMRHKLP